MTALRSGVAARRVLAGTRDAAAAAAARSEARVRHAQVPASTKVERAVTHTIPVESVRKLSAGRVEHTRLAGDVLPDVQVLEGV
jgi:hypothetical protein